MTHSNSNAAPLLTDNLQLFEALPVTHGVLDLACGSGRNGLLLASRGLPVTFADRDRDQLAAVSADHRFSTALCQLWSVDLEQDETLPLAGKTFDAILVFNYLHRALFAQLKAAVRPGGLVIYETFTVAQRAFGRPKRDAFLLQPGELGTVFSDWELIHEFEGELAAPARAVASIIARKPTSGPEAS
jgi:SAM-dependent methyltransferase